MSFNRAGLTERLNAQKIAARNKTQIAHGNGLAILYKYAKTCLFEKRFDCIATLFIISLHKIAILYNQEALHWKFMIKKIGIIGINGRMGSLLRAKIEESNKYEIGIGFGQPAEKYPPLSDVFQHNDCIVDFSNKDLIEPLLTIAANHNKPLVICTTGWDFDMFKAKLNALAKFIPIVIASNTSVGACVQRYLVKEASKLFDSKYDIDVIEKHHREKVDSPSGTALSLIKAITDTKTSEFGLSYKTFSNIHGKREHDTIGILSQRSGNLPGEHEVTFTSSDEMISIKHVVFNRALFATGAIRIIDWVNKTTPTPGIYSMEDVLEV